MCGPAATGGCMGHFACISYFIFYLMISDDRRTAYSQAHLLISVQKLREFMRCAQVPRAPMWIITVSHACLCMSRICLESQMLTCYSHCTNCQSHSPVQPKSRPTQSLRHGSGPSSWTFVEGLGGLKCKSTFSYPIFVYSAVWSLLLLWEKTLVSGSFLSHLHVLNLLFLAIPSY